MESSFLKPISGGKRQKKAGNPENHGRQKSAVHSKLSFKIPKGRFQKGQCGKKSYRVGKKREEKGLEQDQRTGESAGNFG